MSDHGCGMPSIYYLNDFFQIELNLPMLFIIIHDRKNINYNEQYYNIQKNQQTLITGYIHIIINLLNKMVIQLAI